MTLRRSSGGTMLLSAYLGIHDLAVVQDALTSAWSSDFVSVNRDLVDPEEQ